MALSSFKFFSGLENGNLSFAIIEIECISTIQGSSSSSRFFNEM